MAHMMFEEDRSSAPRAYTALPDSPDHPDPAEDLKRAIEWCHGQAGGNLRLIGIQTGSRSDIEDEPLLGLLVRHGASLHVNSRGKVTSLPPGPVLVYRPQPETLWQIEEHGAPSAIVAVGITGPSHFRRMLASTKPVGAQPWVSAYLPVHLGGPVIEPRTPVIPDPVVWEALKSFTNSINSSTGLSHSSDRSVVTEGLMKLKATGHSYDPDDLLAGALALNWRGSSAVELRDLAREINAGKRKRYRPMLRSNIVEIWETNAQTAGQRAELAVQPDN
jgi:hypothetical protein